MEKKNSTERMLEMKIKEEEIKWKQRSPCRWLKEKDRNTVFPRVGFNEVERKQNYFANGWEL